MKRLALACVLVAAPLASAASAQDVIFRDGFELVCPPELGDCDGDGIDCETSLRTVTDCGDCDVPCSRPNADADCTTGNCQIGSCFAGFGNCDLGDANGCEQPLNTLTDCGACGQPCNLANAAESCSTGSCRITTCSPGFGNCDAAAPNGCEQPLNTLSHCGTCFAPCNLANASETCGTGTCQIASCNGGFGNCDGIAANGCEQALNTLSHCGTCGLPCNLPNANESCSTGSCQLTSCFSGYANCDGSQGNGCEVQLSGHSNSLPGEDLGSFDADAQSGFFCPDVACSLKAARTGVRGRYFTVTADENSDCNAPLEMRIQLIVPAGVDYDLHVTGTGFLCSGGCFSTGGTGADETIFVHRNDVFGSQDTFTATIEVRYFGGASCSSWELRVSTGNCVS